METHRLSIPPLSPLLTQCYVVGKKGAQTVKVNSISFIRNSRSGYIVVLRYITKPMLMLFSLCFTLSLPRKCWPQLGGKCASIDLPVYV